MPFLSVGYMEEMIRDANQNSRKKKKVLVIIYFWNNVPGTAGSHSI